MLLKSNEHNYILSLILEDKRKTEELLKSGQASPAICKKIEEDLKIIRNIVLNFKLDSTINFKAKENLLKEEYLLIKQYADREYFWMLDCIGYSPDIAAAGIFTKDEAEHFYRGRVLSLLDLINNKALGLEGYAVSVADYISYQKALVSR